jgi:hypothetical protein
MFRIFERRILRKIYRPTEVNSIWRSRYNHELHRLCNEPHIMKVIKFSKLRWLGHIFRMQEQNACRKLTLQKPQGTRRVGRSAIRWLDSIEEDLKIMGVRNWDERHRIGINGEQSWRGQDWLWTVAPEEEEEEGEGGGEEEEEDLNVTDNQLPGAVSFLRSNTQLLNKFPAFKIPKFHDHISALFEKLWHSLIHKFPIFLSYLS